MGALARIWFLMGTYLLAEKVLGRSVILPVNINICYRQVNNCRWYAFSQICHDILCFGTFILAA